MYCIPLQIEDSNDPEFDSPLNVVDKMYKEMKSSKQPRSSLLNYSAVPRPNDAVKIPMTTDEREAFDALLGQLLDDGHVSQACQLTRQFGHYDQDLSVVVVCYFSYPYKLYSTYKNLMWCGLESCYRMHLVINTLYIHCIVNALLPYPAL